MIRQAANLVRKKEVLFRLSRTYVSEQMKPINQQTLKAPMNKWMIWLLFIINILSSWLLGSAATTYYLSIGGAQQRLLTNSKLVPNGRIYPKSEAEWEVQLNSYKNTQKDAISMNEYKQTFNRQYYHRMASKAFFPMFYLPLIYFHFKKWIPQQAVAPLHVAGLASLTCGAIGAWMSSYEGQDIPQLSHTIHSILGNLTFGTLAYSGFHLFKYKKKDILEIYRPGIRSLRRMSVFLLIFQVVNLATGSILTSFSQDKKKGVIEKTNQNSHHYFWQRIFKDREFALSNHVRSAFLTFGLAGYMAFTSISRYVPKKILYGSLLQFLLLNFQAFSGLFEQTSIVKESYHSANSLLILSITLFIFQALFKFPLK